MRIVTMKFGGTSVADAHAIERLLGLVSRERAQGSAPIVVVSAMSKVTDTLLAMAAGIAQGQAGVHDPADPAEQWGEAIDQIRQRHVAAATALAAEPAEVIAAMDRELTLLARALSAIAVAGQSPRLLDMVAAAGELLSSRLVAAALASRGLPSRWVDGRGVIRTDAAYTCATPDAEAIAAAARQTVLPALAAGEIPVIGGFIGSAPDGSTTTLGRGGSDYSASLIGAAMGAAEIQIWTDVDGMLTADPRIVPSPRLVAQLSFAEASELAYFGAKVLHPSTILPAIGRNIPVRILNSRRPDVAGTLIAGSPAPDAPLVTALACKRGITVIDVTSTRMLMAHGFLRRVFETFERHQTAVDVVTTSEVSVSVTVDDDRRLDAIVHDLREFAAVSVEREMAILCAVGETLRAAPEGMSRVIGMLSRFPLRMVSQAASRRNLTVVLGDAAAIDAMRYLHGEVFDLAPAGRS